MVFGVFDGIVYLYGLYRDDHIRMWSIKTGQCVSMVNCVPNDLETRTHGCKELIFLNVICLVLTDSKY